MKKILPVIVVLILAISFLIFNGKQNTKPQTLTTKEASSFHPDPSSATFLFEGESITLSNGRAEKILAPNSAIKEEIILTNNLAYGDLNNDGFIVVRDRNANPTVKLP